MVAPEEVTRMDDRQSAVRALAARRWRVALALTAVIMGLYVGFVLLVAFDKALLGRLLAPGLSLGILLGALLIVAAWLLTGVYVWWANGRYDAEVARLNRQGGAE
jgi:uncharacterized membrane protein (DUF485 family)